MVLQILRCFISIVIIIVIVVNVIVIVIAVIIYFFCRGIFEAVCYYFLNCYLQFFLPN